MFSPAWLFTNLKVQIMEFIKNDWKKHTRLLLSLNKYRERIKGTKELNIYTFLWNCNKIKKFPPSFSRNTQSLIRYYESRIEIDSIIKLYNYITWLLGQSQGSELILIQQSQPHETTKTKASQPSLTDCSVMNSKKPLSVIN